MKKSRSMSKELIKRGIVIIPKGMEVVRFNMVSLSITQSHAYQNVSSAVNTATNPVPQSITNAAQGIGKAASAAWSWLAGGKP